MPIISGGGGGASLTPPVVITGTDANATVLTLAGKVGDQNADTLVVTDGGSGSFAAGGRTSEGLATVHGRDPAQHVLQVKSAAAQAAPAIFAIDANGNDYLSAGGTSGVTLSADPVTGKTELQITPAVFTYRDELGNTVIDIEGGYVSLGASGAVFVTPNNYLAFSNHTAPADAELSAGDCALWFDQTNGVGNTKLMVKGKSADGTVKTASIVLA